MCARQMVGCRRVNPAVVAGDLGGGKVSSYSCAGVALFSVVLIDIRYGRATHRIETASAGCGPYGAGVHLR